jgi:hypothetical protein
MPRSGFKTSDQIQGQGVRPIRRRPRTSVGLWRDKSGKRSIHRYVSICRRPATQPLGLRWGFETTSKHDKRVALLTGGNRGIGYAIGRSYAQRGITVILGVRDPNK